MKTRTILLAAMLPVIFACGHTSSLEDDFRNPKDKISTGVYWYWMSDNISKEGVIADLEAMKRAGINSAFIGNIGGQGAPYGKVKIFTDEWWDILHAALKTASDLGIEIGMFNCPGWSQSGGPWIEPSQSMRYLTASETRLSVARNGAVSLQLPAPSGAARLDELTDRFEEDETRPCSDFQDVCVLAVPAGSIPPTPTITVSGNIVKSDPTHPERDPRVHQRPEVPTASPIYPQFFLTETGREGEKAIINLKYAQPLTARSPTVYPAGMIHAKAELQAKIAGEFRTIKTFTLERTNAKTFVGFRPYATVVASFEATTASEFRLVLTGSDQTGAIGRISLSETPAVDQYPEKSFARLYQGPSPVWDYYRWPAQTADAALVPGHEQVIDLTSKMDSTGLLRWDDATVGDWLILRMGMVPTYSYNSPSSPEGTGLEMDKINAAPVARHFDSYIGEVLRRVPAADRRSLKVIVGDSWERGGQTFTDGFIETFRTRYGYDPTPYLPVLTGHVIDNTEVSDRFLWDVRRLTADLASTEYVGALSAEANRHGIETWLENYGDWGFSGECLIYGKHANRVGSEFWTNQTKPYVPVTASCAHIYNKSAVYAEAFTSAWGSYAYHPGNIKRISDFAFADGMTRCVMHVYIQQAYEDRYPGIDTWFGAEFNRKNTWFGQIDLFTDYLKRCGLMLEQGLDVADIAYFIGENVPVNCGPLEMRENEADYDHYVSQVPDGYHVDYVNYDVILNSMTVENGLLTLPHGTRYRMLALPPVETMRPELIEKIESLVAQGAVVVGAPPVKSPSLQGYPEADNKVKEIAEKLWGTANPNRVLNPVRVDEKNFLQQALDAQKIIPDFRAGREKVKYAHRTTADREIYFISNQKNERISFTPEFRVGRNGAPAISAIELWNPATGEIRPLPEFEVKGETIAIPLEMEAFESYFVVFNTKNQPSKIENQKPATKNFPSPQTVVEITSPWTVTFESDSVHRGPAEPVVFDSLTDWSKNEDERIRYYSGTAIYKTIFNGFKGFDALKGSLNAPQLFLEFDKVGVMAKVKVNGKYVGGVWTPPYRVDITDAIKDGDNEIEVETVNLWLNRMVGDRLLPETERKVATNRVGSRTELRESGIVGGVRIVAL